MIYFTFQNGQKKEMQTVLLTILV